MFVIGGILLLLACLTNNFRCSSSLEFVRMYPHGLTTDFSSCKAYPRLELNSTLLMSLLNSKMGVDSASSSVYYSSAYLAATQTEAEAGFVNMMPVYLAGDSSNRLHNVYGINDDDDNDVNSEGTSGSATNIKQMASTKPLVKKDIVSLLSATKQHRSLLRRLKRQATAHDVISSSLVLPEEIGFPNQVYQASGAVSTIEYCRPHGEESGLAMLPLCSMCAMTTHLPDTYFPPLVNEIYCNGSSPSVGNGCLHVNGMNHGTCQQTTIWFSVLQAQPDKCELVTLLDNVSRLDQLRFALDPSSPSASNKAVIPPSWRSSTYYIDGWAVVGREVNTGCECLLHKDSFLSNIAKRR